MTKKRKYGPLDHFFQTMSTKKKKPNQQPKPPEAKKLSLPVKYSPFLNCSLLEELFRYGSTVNPIRIVPSRGKGQPRKINKDAHILHSAMYAGVAMTLFNYLIELSYYPHHVGST